MPAQTLDQPLRWPLLVVPTNRDESTSKDAKLVNGYVEKDPLGDYFIYKRPGLSQYSQPSGTTGTGGGIYNWKGNIYSVVGNTLYKDTTSKGTVDTSGGVYRFDSCLGATPKLILGNGVKAYTYDDAGGLVQITDVDFPAAFVKGWAYLDGTTYVMKSNANIQGDAINDPTSWDPINVIVAQIEPDGGVAMAKQLIYAVALKQWSAEVFYDAGNAAGSPLGPVPAAKANYGCISADSVQDLDGALFWICTNKNADAQVMKMENLSTSIISTSAVDRLLDGCDFSVVYSFTLKHEGHHWYGVTMKNSNLTLVYDTATGMWSQWADTSGNYIPIVSSTFVTSSRAVLQHESNGRLYYMDAQHLTDDGSLFSVDIVTPNFDAGVDRRKQLNMLRFWADAVPGSVLNVRCSDDDYQSWSNFRNVDFSKKRPFLTNCGTFYRRAYHLRHRCNTTFRIRAMDLQLDIGTL